MQFRRFTRPRRQLLSISAVVANANWVNIELYGITPNAITIGLSCRYECPFPIALWGVQVPKFVKFLNLHCHLTCKRFAMYRYLYIIFKDTMWFSPCVITKRHLYYYKCSAIFSTVTSENRIEWSVNDDSYTRIVLVHWSRYWNLRVS